MSYIVIGMSVVTYVTRILIGLNWSYSLSPIIRQQPPITNTPLKPSCSQVGLHIAVNNDCIIHQTSIGNRWFMLVQYKFKKVYLIQHGDLMIGHISNTE